MNGMETFVLDYWLDREIQWWTRVGNVTITLDFSVCFVFHFSSYSFCMENHWLDRARPLIFVWVLHCFPPRGLSCIARKLIFLSQWVAALWAAKLCFLVLEGEHFCPYLCIYAFLLATGFAWGFAKFVNDAYHAIVKLCLDSLPYSGVVLLYSVFRTCHFFRNGASTVYGISSQQLGGDR
ncbi:hypothetical protein B0T26DRAFT_44291 [Lasiosphaeria miniovina]|uniref:Uncharacterized protein n=1 Tax=Lasiosphaeria miniovina TaxID=1954250 RepID=A0AA40BGP3_9PEZI|nr:uncharacterized protein B0T26DRAFT_44291 [Lasiosphaeria miniovina]KAK0733906.1 hypothetical protein B0T26DRAFT_44291 [Lasiosphaeria miniovina]